MKRRRMISMVLIFLGGVLIFLAPEEAPWAGVVFLVSGLLVEAAGWWMESRKEGK